MKRQTIFGTIAALALAIVPYISPVPAYASTVTASAVTNTIEQVTIGGTRRKNDTLTITVVDVDQATIFL